MAREVLLRARGFGIAAKIWGRDGGHPLLAVHGWQDNANTWKFLGPRLAELGYHVIGVDLPGHGRSEHRPACVPYSASDYVLQLGHLVQEMGWPSLTLVGHSLGASVCSALESALAPRVRRLVMLEAVGFFPREADTAADSLRMCLEQDELLRTKRPRVYPSLRKAAIARMATAEGAPGDQTLSMEGALALCRRGTIPVDLLQARDARHGHYGPGKEELDPARWQSQEEAEEGGEALADPDAPVELSFRHDLRMRAASPLYYSEAHCRALLESIQAPTLVALAERGWPSPTDVYKERVKCIRNVEVHHIPGASHHPHLDPETAGVTADIVCRFLALDGSEEEHRPRL